MGENKEIIQEEISRFAKLLREKRIEKKLSQTELSEIITGTNTRRSFISNFENEKTVPSFITVLKILDVLGYKIEYVEKE